MQEKQIRSHHVDEIVWLMANKMIWFYSRFACLEGETGLSWMGHKFMSELRINSWERTILIALKFNAGNQSFRSIKMIAAVSAIREIQNAVDHKIQIGCWSR